MPVARTRPSPRYLWLAVASLALLIALPSRAQTLAYVTSSTDNQEIRLVEADGSSDRSYYRVPENTPPLLAVGSLSWRPNGSEIVFNSGLDNALSMAIRDLHGVSLNGTRRRITNGPEPGTLGSRPKGQVTVGVRSPAFGAELLVYIEGSTDFVRFIADPDVNYTVTFTSVADFGPGIRQNVRVYNATPRTGYPCNFDIALSADVVPGQSVDAGFISLILTDFACFEALSPSWLADGSGIVYLARAVHSGAVPPNNLYLIDEPPVPLEVGQEILDMSQFLNNDRLYRVAAGPTPRADEILYLQDNGFRSTIYLGTLANPGVADVVNVDDCQALACEVLDVEWLADGSGFLFSRFDERGFVYRYEFASGTTRELLRADGGAIGEISLSSDGRTIALEYASRLADDIDSVRFGPRLQCPCEIWVAEIDGSNPRRLITDGRAPAWRPNGQPLPPDLVFASSFGG